MSLNRIHLVGYVGRDPEAKYFESGAVKCFFTLAVNRRSSNRDEQPDWFDLEIWGKQAETAANYVKKGSLIGVVGSLRFDRWQDRNTGKERQKPVIVVDRWEFVGSKRDNNTSQEGGYDKDF